MDDHPPADLRSRDYFSSPTTYDLSTAVYGSFPACAPPETPPSVRRSRATSPTKKQQQHLSHSSPASHLSIQIARSTAALSWLSHTNRSKHPLHHQIMDPLHQSTCLNLNMATADNTSDADLWILPDFDDWEAETDAQQQPASKSKEGEWAPLLRRAAKSNLERLRARLEGDGWAFVGGKYGEDEKAIKEAAMASEGEESVDEEFDVVVLPVVRASC